MLDIDMRPLRIFFFIFINFLTTPSTQLTFKVDRSDFDMIDYLNELREGCLEAYTGIIQVCSCNVVK